MMVKYIENQYFMNIIRPTWSRRFNNVPMWHVAVAAVGIIHRQTDDRNIMVFTRHRIDAVEEEVGL